MFDRLIDLLVSIWIHIKPIVFIEEFEKAVVFRGGRYIKNWNPGAHLRIPLVDDFYSDVVTPDTQDIREVNVTTLDGKTISIGCQFNLMIIDIKKALVDTHEWRTNLIDISRGILSDHLEDCSWEDIRKKTTKNAVEKKIQKRCDEMGIEISDFNFTDKALSRVFKLFNN